MRPHYRRGDDRGRRGKRLRAALHYVEKGEPTPEEQALWRKSGWNGCKLWGACGGTRCKDGDPDEQGRMRFRTPAKLPRSRPEGCHPVDRKMSRCPVTECEPWIWSAIQQWGAWSMFRGLPLPGSLWEQPARLLDAIRILESESSLLDAYHAERATDRARRRHA